MKTQKIVPLVYIGRRTSKKGAVWAFQTSDGGERYFGRISGVWIGHTYEATAKGISRRPKQTDAKRIDNPKWEAEDAIVDAVNLEKRAAKKFADASSPHIKAAVTALLPLTRGLNMFDVDKLVRALVISARNRK